MILCANPSAQFHSYQDEIEAAVLKVLRSNRYILGEEVEALENEFADYIGTHSAIGVANGTDALEIAIRALDIGPGDEVITVSHTAVATVAAIEAAGATPVLVDVDPIFYTINPAQLQEVLTLKTKAVLAVHLYGQAVRKTSSLFSKYFFTKDRSKMKVSKSKLEGIILIEPKLYADERGFFLESFEQKKYQELGIVEDFVQDNHSCSQKNVLRGLHFTKSKPQSQIVIVIRGRVFDVVVDIRKDSPTFRQWFGSELSSEGPRQIYMPHGFAHGFCVLSDWADLHYKVSGLYDPDDESGILWNDSAIGIVWPFKKPFISKRDKEYLSIKQWFYRVNNGK